MDMLKKVLSPLRRQERPFGPGRNQLESWKRVLCEYPMALTKWPMILMHYEPTYIRVSRLHSFTVEREIEISHYIEIFTVKK